MNWFDTAGFANLAKSAFSSAQKTIDRALDIHEDKPTDMLSTQLNEGEKFVDSHSLSSQPESSVDSNDTDKQVPAITKENYQEDSDQFIASNSKEGDSINKTTENNESAVFSQPQQSCVFPLGKQSHLTEESWPENRAKEDECGMESSTKIDVHLTVTQLLTGLTPFLSQASSNIQKPLQSSQQVLPISKIFTAKEKSEATHEQKKSCSNIDRPSHNSFISTDKLIDNNNLEGNSEKVTVTKELSQSTKCVPEHEVSSEKSSFTTHDREPSDDSNLEHIEKYEHSDTLTLPESIVSISEDMLSNDSLERTGLSTERPCNLVIAASCDYNNEGSGDQINIYSEIKELETSELREYDIKSSDSLGSLETNSSCSFVKCSTGLSEPCSTSDHSDAQKYEYEHCSGHTSGEENETTSSDIEIISSPNGENGERQSSNHLKHTWFSKTYGRRSESPNYDSNFMPAVQEVEEDIYDQHLRPDFYKDGESSIDCEDDAELLSKGLMEQPHNIGEFVQRQTTLEQIVENREKKLLKLSQEMAELYDINSRLESEIKRLEEIRNKDSRNTSEMTQEFTQRIAQLESKLCEAVKERDTAKAKLEALEKEALSRPCAAEVEKTIKEKDQLITELMSEGEKLSKQQLQHSSLIKKLRNKDKEKENMLKTQKEMLEEQSKELERLRRSLGAKDDQEKKHINTIRQLTISVQEKEKDLAALKTTLESVIEESNSIKKSLDNSYREMVELHRSNAEKDIQVQEIALSSEIAAKGELQQALENVKKEAAKEKDTLLAQLEELQHARIQAEQQAHCREEALQSEIIQIRKRLQESENHAEELSTQISSATLPLLQQIDNLQSMLASRSASWEKSEENLFERLNELQDQMLLSEEQEKLIRKSCDEFSSKLADVCLQLNTVKQEKVQLTSQLELAHMKIAVLEETKNREAGVKQDLVEEINKLKLDKDELSCQLVTLQSELEMEKQKAQKLEEQLQDKLKLRDEKSSNGTSSPTSSRLNSLSERLHVWMEDNYTDAPLGMSLSTCSQRSLYDIVRLGSQPSILENFQSQLKQKDGEIAQLQSEILQLEKIRDSMGQELADISNQYEALKTDFCEANRIKTEFSDIEQKYNTLLQMYGEKVEEAEELQLDLQDVKAMYKAQLDELLKKS